MEHYIQAILTAWGWSRTTKEVMLSGKTFSWLTYMKDIDYLSADCNVWHQTYLRSKLSNQPWNKCSLGSFQCPFSMDNLIAPDGNEVHPHDELSWLWSMKFGHLVELSQWLSQFSGCNFLWQDAILEDNFEYGAVIIWLGHQHRNCRGTFQDYLRLWIKAFRWVLIKLSSFEVVCPVIFCMHKSGQICGVFLILWKMEGLLFGLL